MEKNVWLDLGYWAQKRAGSLGANDSSINISHSRSVEVDYRDGEVEKMKESTQQSMGIEVYANGRYSSHSTNDLRKESLEKFIQNAVDLTAYLEEDKFRGLADPELYKGQPEVDLDLRDPEYEKITTESRKARAAELGEHVQGQDERLISVASGFSDYHGESYKLKSNGFEGHRETTYYSQYAEVSLQGEGDRKPQSWRYYSSRHLADMPGTKQTALEALKRTQDQVGQEKAVEGRHQSHRHISPDSVQRAGIHIGQEYNQTDQGADHPERRGKPGHRAENIGLCLLPRVSIDDPLLEDLPDLLGRIPICEHLDRVPQEEVLDVRFLFLQSQKPSSSFGGQIDDRIDVVLQFGRFSHEYDAERPEDLEHDPHRKADERRGCGSSRHEENTGDIDEEARPSGLTRDGEGQQEDTQYDPYDGRFVQPCLLGDSRHRRTPSMIPIMIDMFMM